jgi:hypothetical protein
MNHRGDFKAFHVLGSDPLKGADLLKGISIGKPENSNPEPRRSRIEL